MYKLTDKTCKMLKKVGLTPMQIMAYQSSLNEEFNNFKLDMSHKAYLLFQIVATNVLSEEDYFGEDSQKIKSFFDECVNLLDSITAGATTWEECIALFTDLTGIQVDLDSVADVSLDDKVKDK